MFLKLEFVIGLILYFSKVSGQGPQADKISFQAYRPKITNYSFSMSKPRLNYMQSALSERKNDEDRVPPLKYHELKNNYNPIQADFLSKMDKELIRLNNQINVEHQNLSDRLHRLRFQSDRTKFTRDKMMREYQDLKQRQDLSSLYRKT